LAAPAGLRRSFWRPMFMVSGTCAAGLKTDRLKNDLAWFGGWGYKYASIGVQQPRAQVMAHDSKVAQSLHVPVATGQFPRVRGFARFSSSHRRPNILDTPLVRSPEDSVGVAIRPRRRVYGGCRT